MATPPPPRNKPVYTSAPAAAVPKPGFFKRRSVIMALSSAVIIGVGAYTGAALKTDVEKAQVVKEFKSESPEAQIERLNAYIAELKHQKERVDVKIREVETGQAAIGAERRRQ